ncbi:putative mitochondrial hypothetical protein [Leptomonas pyrrhocoris]|uniref:Uncharacterized protein n=1 Tax=Leptomonas pyrrhocoris TaxID=157538 RepID=A0A0M9FQ04_LEPPY|nr:putative mitochondrial hypothetical protein [Leptomonas pyrrhocoris]KPA73647.1 putative mitochondrial hypothetical protein [Leptomonas pyrrhocoris]|eukprot:XP_015652086.1 putative mitochondrial hypothetical protein [Leptomonas pyrrhocoris]
MLRRSLARRIDVRHTCAPSFMQHPAELGFYYPRFHPATHIHPAGIPEINDAVALMTRHSARATPQHSSSSGDASPSTPPSFAEYEGHQGGKPLHGLPPARWTTTVSTSARPTTDVSAAEAQKDNTKSLELLERGIDILNSVGGAGSSAVANLIRPLFAARFELLNGSEHLPRSAYAMHEHVQKVILKQSAALLYHNDAWDKTDVNQLDTTCVIVGHFVKAFCALHLRPFHQAQSSTTAAAAVRHPAKRVGGATAPTPSATPPVKNTALFNADKWKVQVGDCESESLTLSAVMSRVDELLRLSAAAYGKYGTTHPELRWLRPKLLVLKALLTIPLTGHLLQAQQLVLQALSYVDSLTRRTNLLLDGLNGRVQEPELGLFLLLRAEMASLIFDWEAPVGQVEDDLLHAYDEALRFYPEPYVTTIDADGIMSETHLPTRRFEAEAYTCCLRSYARFLQNAPRPPATSTRDAPVFLPKQIFSLNPLLTVATSSPLMYSDIRNTVPLTLESCRRRTGEALDKALKLNRMLHPELRQNPTAASTLLAMACMYADTRDYLYATGLFESAKKAVVQVYGEASLEHVLVQKLRYEFLAGVGSEQEAKTASHEVIHLLKRVDSLPSA